MTVSLSERVAFPPKIRLVKEPTPGIGVNAHLIGNTIKDRFNPFFI